MLIDFGTRMVQSKIVFYGCAMSGKTTALKALYNQLNGGKKIVSIETSHMKESRTLFYDYGELDLSFGIWKLRLNLWTATGQDFYCATRPIVLSGTDGILFVIDSRKELLEDNLKSWNELKAFFGNKLETTIPVVMCLNKRDLPDVIPLPIINSAFELQAATKVHETIATRNYNIYPPFKELFEGIFQIHRTAKNTILNQLREFPKKIN
jgi:GTPase SAR1 family protein